MTSLDFHRRFSFFEKRFFLSSLGEGLIGLCAGVLAAFFTGLFALDFTAPLRPKADYVFALFHAKSLLDFGDVHVNPAMGFPGTGHFEAHPFPDGIEHLIWRLEGLFTQDPFVVMTVYLVVCAILLGFSTYLALRATRIDRLMAFAGAFVYATSGHFVERAPVHPWFCLMIGIPWICRLCLLLPYQGARLGQKPLALSLWGAFVAGLLVGGSVLYFVFFAGFFLALAMGIQLLQGRGLARLKPGLAALAGNCGLYLLLSLPLILLVLTRGEVFPSRNLFFQPIYALRLPDLVIPKLPFLTDFYDSFHAQQDRLSDEGNYQVFGLWGIIGFFAGFWAFIHPGLWGRAKAARRAPMLRWGAAFILAGTLFAVPYGLGFVFNMLVSGVIRSQVRIGAFMLPIALFMTPAVLAPLRAKMPRAVFASFVLGLALLTSYPFFFATAREQVQTRALWEARKQSLTATLAAMDRVGLMRIAQYPSYYMPEGPATPAFSNSDHLLPFLLDKTPGRHWSFGSMVFENNWVRLAQIFRLPTDQWLRALESLGFDAILIEKDGLPTPSDADIIAPLRKAPYAEGLVYEDAARLLYRLPHPRNR
jgi:hypothetical protein